MSSATRHEVERKAGDERTSEELKRGVEAVDLAPVMVVAWDRSGTITLFNPAAEQVTGWSRDEAFGRSFVEVLVAEEHRAVIGPKLAAGGIVDGILRTRAGTSRRVRWRIAQAPSAHEGDGATFAFGADVTDEDEAREHENQKLRLDAAGTLIAGLAHEVRNPLNGAGLHLAVLERALEKDGTPDMVEAVHVVGAELRRLASLVTDFLDLARPNALLRAPVDARALCERAIADASAAASAANVRIATEYPTHDVVFEGDATKLGQAMAHLLANAIEALLPGGGNVTVRVRRDPRHAWIEVEDDGPGLPAPNAPIFDAFYSKKADGAGLGLAIVHRIVSDHLGGIDVESGAGRTRFRLRLPLAGQGKEP